MNTSTCRMQCVNVLLVIIALLPPPAWGSKPTELNIEVVGQFDANRNLSGSFATIGATNAEGTFSDSPEFSGQAIHITRTMATVDGELIVLKINSNHVSGSVSVPDWCPPPATVPSGMMLFPEKGNWKIQYGTGKYATLNGVGSWASWVIFDPTLGLPVAATECLAGEVQID